MSAVNTVLESDLFTQLSVDWICMKKNRWTILTFVVINNMFAFALPSMALSVLSKQIAADLGMSVVQLGILWGSVSILSIFSSFFGGAIVDKVGPKNMLIIFGLMTGILGIARALTQSFYPMIAVTMALGAIAPFLTLSNFKIFHDYFSKDEIVLANGFMSAGMALGFLLGAQLSATVLAPLLGGWRNVFILYSGSGMLMSLVWLRLLPTSYHVSEHSQPSIFSAIGDVVKNPSVWFMGFGILGVNGAINGVLGYLPFYLQDIGWSINSASASLTVFHTTSLIFTMPIVLYSSRVLARRNATLMAGTSIFLGFLLLTFATGWVVWPAVVLAGFSRDGFMALFFTQVSETRGVKQAMIATAIGMTMMLNGLGSIFSPPAGNAFEAISPAAPFGFWAALALSGVICLAIVAWKETRPEIGV